jgi:hypothetical protein
MKHDRNKPLILQLLVADMKHEQLLEGLHRLGFHSELHGSGLSTAVAELMGTRKEDISEEWFEQYMRFLHKATRLEITGNGGNLLPLAELCYESLVCLS